MHHSDRGGQGSTRVLPTWASPPRSARSPTPTTNALAESFVGTLKTELVAGRVFGTRFEAELAVVEYLGWFNHTRLHESLDDVPPAEFEALCAIPTETITDTLTNEETN